MRFVFLLCALFALLSGALFSSVRSQATTVVESPSVIQPWNGDSSRYLMGILHFTSPMDPALGNGQIVLDALEEWLNMAPFHMRIVSGVRPFLDWQSFAGSPGGSTFAAVTQMNAAYLSGLTTKAARDAAASGLAPPSVAEDALESGVFITVIMSTNTSNQENWDLYVNTITQKMFDSNVNLTDPNVLVTIPWPLRPTDPQTGLPLSSYDWTMGMWIQEVWLCHNAAGVAEESASNYLSAPTNIKTFVPYPYVTEAEESIQLVYDTTCRPTSPYKNPVGFGVGFSLGILGCFSLIGALIITDIKIKKAAAEKFSQMPLKKVIGKE